MSGTLWLGAGLCGFGFVSAIIVIGLDKYGTKQLGTDGDIKTASKLVKPRDILSFNVSFWLMALTIMFFYNGKGTFLRLILAYQLVLASCKKSIDNNPRMIGFSLESLLDVQTLQYYL